MRLEPIADPSPMRRVLPVVIALAATVILAGFLALVSGSDPMAVLGLIVKGAVGSKFAALETLNRATPLIFTGLAIAVAFRARLWNIGAEAQLYAGALVTVLLGTGALPLPAPVLIPVMALGAIVAGAAMLVGPALLKLRLGVDEVVTTLLLNFVMLLFISMLLEGPLKDPMGMGWPKSAPLLKEARLPRIVSGLRLHWGFGLALIAALAVWLLDRHTVAGFEMRAVGAGETAARFAGIRVPRVVIRTAVLSGGLAALAGFSEVAGLKGNLTLDLSPGYGYTGIVVAMLAGLNPLGVVLSALFVAAIFVGADSMSRAAGVPTYIADMLLAFALLAMVLALTMTRYRLRRA
ncbi:ABC transporter permease [Paracoccus aestuariivivens]|uniref:ABC transporter permease n=1 Tax=Paracoccus aestuariivivens TaxID=1820333 RepID=A0A6L6JCJ6_9RHOB|nr:ABC transporter permease [Paracoccus aestuariivivens]MTH79226.1 ABC transporter permease [Paracoccus aestuariivivens]